MPRRRQSSSHSAPLPVMVEKGLAGLSGAEGATASRQRGAVPVIRARSVAAVCRVSEAAGGRHEWSARSFSSLTRRMPDRHESCACSSAKSARSKRSRCTTDQSTSAPSVSERQRATARRHHPPRETREVRDRKRQATNARGEFVPAMLLASDALLSSLFQLRSSQRISSPQNCRRTHLGTPLRLCAPPSLLAFEDE